MFDAPCKDDQIAQALHEDQLFLTRQKHGCPQWPGVLRNRLGSRLISTLQENRMPIIAWLLGVPISVILILMLFGVF